MSAPASDSNDAIPRQLPAEVPGAPRELTRIYFDDGTAFGHQLAAPRTDESPAVTRHLGWSDEQITQAAEIGARDGDELTVDAVEQVCRRYIDLEQREVTHATEIRDLTRQLATAQGVAAARQQRGAELYAELVGEREERNRLAALHATQSDLICRMISGAPPPLEPADHVLDQAFDRAARTVTGMGAEALCAELAAETLRFPTAALFDDSDTAVVDMDGSYPPGGIQ